jgi:hypothetical protein
MKPPLMGVADCILHALSQGGFCLLLGTESTTERGLSTTDSQDITYLVCSTSNGIHIPEGACAPEGTEES